MTNIEKIKQLEAKRTECEEKAQKYKQRAADLSQQIKNLKSTEIQNILNQVDMPFEDVVKMLADLTGVPTNTEHTQSPIETDKNVPKN